MLIIICSSVFDKYFSSDINADYAKGMVDSLIHLEEVLKKVKEVEGVEEVMKLASCATMFDDYDLNSPHKDFAKSRLVLDFFSALKTNGHFHLFLQSEQGSEHEPLVTALGADNAFKGNGHARRSRSPYSSIFRSIALARNQSVGVNPCALVIVEDTAAWIDIKHKSEDKDDLLSQHSTFLNNIYFVPYRGEGSFFASMTCKHVNDDVEGKDASNCNIFRLCCSNINN
ncbi:MAG: hypothetical protein JKY92_05805 [Magnetovibrio sp.]|nr:hypothetical protein [Magnetovibrio sp.]